MWFLDYGNSIQVPATQTTWIKFSKTGEFGILRLFSQRLLFQLVSLAWPPASGLRQGPIPFYNRMGDSTKCPTPCLGEQSHGQRSFVQSARLADALYMGLNSYPYKHHHFEVYSGHMTL